MAIPINPTISAEAGVNAVTLSWGAVSGATGFKVYRSEAGAAAWLQIYSGTALTFKDMYAGSTAYLQNYLVPSSHLGLTTGKEYSYKVTAFNGDGESSGATLNSTPVADTPVVTRARIKAPATIYIGNGTQVVDQYIEIHDWIRANITTKIAFALPNSYLSEPTHPVMAQVINWVATYGYEILTIVQTQWFPTVLPWATNFQAYVSEMQDSHNKCLAVFGKAPVAATAWSFNSVLAEKSRQLGYRLCPSGIRNQSGVDGYSGMGVPLHFYKPSPNANAVPGDGSPAKTVDIFAGLIPICGGFHLTTFEGPADGTVGLFDYDDNVGIGGLHTGGSARGSFISGQTFIADINMDLKLTKNNTIGAMEASDSPAWNTPYWYAPPYLDPYWYFQDPTWRGTGTPTGESESWYITKRILLWQKERYANSIDHCTYAELADYLETVISDVNPCPATFVWVGDPREEFKDIKKGFRFDSKKYHLICRIRIGVNGVVKIPEEIIYDVNWMEPQSPTHDWSVKTGILGPYSQQTISPQSRIFSFTIGSTTTNLHLPDPSFTVGDPTYTSDAGSITVLVPVHDPAGTTLLFNLHMRITETAFTVYHSEKHGSVADIREFQQLYGTDESIPHIDTLTAEPPIDPPVAGSGNIKIRGVDWSNLTFKVRNGSEFVNAVFEVA